jgi:hypothetical protein
VQLLDELSKSFSIQPSLRVSERVSTNWYCEEKNEIVLMPGHHMGPKASLVHEFAHALDYSRHHRKRKHPYHHHGQRFYSCLIEVIEQAYAKQHYYPWRYEYEPLQRLALKDGYWNGWTV